MSDPILPLAVWEEGTLQNDVPANDNALRVEAMRRPVLGTEDSPTSSIDGDVFFVGGSPSGAFATFDPNDIAIYRGGNWYAWAPVEGLQVNGYTYTGSGGWVASGGGSAIWGSITGTLSDQTDLQSALEGKEDKRTTVTSVSSSSGVVTLNYALGDYFTLTLTENVTSWVISNPPGSGQGFTLMVQITQDSTPRTVAKPGTTAGGSALDVSTGSGDIDLLAITSFNNGTTLRSSIAKDFS